VLRTSSLVVLCVISFVSWRFFESKFVSFGHGFKYRLSHQNLKPVLRYS
jgi:hypothetical protein